MANHPNRGQSKYRHPAAKPDPAAIEAARREQRITMRQAADMIYSTESAWRAWEDGRRPMHAGLWELFKLKVRDSTTLARLGLNASGPAAGHTGQREARPQPSTSVDADLGHVAATGR